jgi:AcrR family transcriptional regulator
MPRPADRRAKIELLRAAEAVFVEHGLNAAKVEDITARAGVSKGAFYLHFESKEDCFRQIVEGFVAKLATCVGDPHPSPPQAVAPAHLAELIAVWHAHDVDVFEFCWQNRGLMGILFSGGGGAPYAYLIDEFAERMSGQIEAWARQLIAAGIYRADVDPTVLPALISGGYERLMRAMIKRPKRPDIAAWARQAMGLYLRGLLTDEARAVVDRQVKWSPDESGPVPVVHGDPSLEEGPASAASPGGGRVSAGSPVGGPLEPPAMQLRARER